MVIFHAMAMLNNQMVYFSLAAPLPNRQEDHDSPPLFKAAGLDSPDIARALLASQVDPRKRCMAWREIPREIWGKSYSYGHLPVITGYKWDYTFYKWGYKYL